MAFGSTARSFSETVLERARKEIGLVAAFLVIAALVLAFGSIAEEVLEGDSAAFDRRILLMFRHAGNAAAPIGPPWLQEAARDVTSLGSVSLLGLIFLVVLGYLLMVRKRGAAWFMLASVLGGQALSTVLKMGFERPRPDLVPHATQVFTASFPSGHAMLSAVTYLTLGALLTRALPGRRLKIYVMSVAVFLTLITGVSRVYLGVHWPTDVLAGWCVGAAWSILCWAVALRLQRAGAVEKPAEPLESPTDPG